MGYVYVKNIVKLGLEFRNPIQRTQRRIKQIHIIIDILKLRHHHNHHHHVPEGLGVFPDP